MKRSDWNDRAATQAKLIKSLKSLTRAVKKISYAYSTVEQIAASIAEISNTEEWKQLSVSQAFQMVKRLSVHNAGCWRDAASQYGNSYDIFRVLKSDFQTNGQFLRLIQKNAQYIRSLPLDVAKHVTQHAATEAIAGKRAEALVESIRAAAPELSNARINLIARTETAKTQLSITQVRSENLGIQYYRWQTSEDQRVRSSHKHMQGVICSFTSPPSPEELDGQPTVGNYGPGGIWNCRCFPSPIIDLDYEKFPAKVVRNGRIVQMTKKEFEAIQ